MLGAFLLMRRSMLDEIGGWDAGFRHYCEDIDLCYRAMQAGWERWYVPDAVVTHDYAAVIDRRVPLAAHALARARHGPLRPQASRAPARPVKDDQYARQAEDWTERAYADAATYLAHRAELVIAPRAASSSRVTRCSISPAGTAASGSCWSRAAFATAESTRRRRWSRRRSVDSAIAPSVEAGDLNEYVPPAPVAATTVFRAIYYARDRRAFFRHVAAFTRRSSSST